MALDDDKVNLLLLAFFKIFLARCPRRRRLPPPIDLLELSADATILPFVVVVVWQQRFDGRFWWVEPRQYIYHDAVEDDIWYTSHDMLDKKYLDTF